LALWADGHEHGAQDHGPPLPDEPVGEHTAEERGKVDKSGIEPGGMSLASGSVLGHGNRIAH
jgi:hypothetical protein